MDSMSSLVSVKKLRLREERPLTRVTHKEGQSGQGHRPTDLPLESGWDSLLPQPLSQPLSLHSSAGRITLEGSGGPEPRGPPGQRAGSTSTWAKSCPCGSRLRES